MWRCEACETTIPADSAFCPYCGRAVAVDPPPAAEAESAPSPPPPPASPPARRAVKVAMRRPRWDALAETASHRASGLSRQPIDRLVALLGALLAVIGFLAAVAGGPGGYPWLGLGIAALLGAAYLRMDRGDSSDR